MKKSLLFALTLCLATTAEAQIFYLTTFPTGSFPSGWAPTDSRIVLSNESQSAGYVPPPASGGYNARFDNCQPSGQTVRLVVSGVISTVNKTNLRVGFGRRASNAWSNSVSLQYSTNGTSWSIVPGATDVAAGASQTWDNLYFDFPPGSNAENQPNLRFRFSYITSLSADCDSPPNFRIDDFAVGENNSLPVELASFEARSVPPHVRLDWATASETENDFFAVERSADGRAFDEIGRLRGAGTTRTVQHYTFVDERPARNANYYRLRQVDQDGAATYSPVRLVELPGMERVRLYPVPARELLQVELAEPSDGTANWEILDLTGRLLANGVFPSDARDASIPVQDFFPGTYLWRLVAARQTWTAIFQKY